MIRDHFRVLVVDLGRGRGRIEEVDGRDSVAGGSGLAAMLFARYGSADRPWDDPGQPLIFAIGPLTGLFPLMSKTVCAFRSPYLDQYTESHAGGRSALALRFADLDGLVITGRAPTLSCLVVGSRTLAVEDVHFMAGMDVLESGKLLRSMFGGSGHRSILRIGPAGEQGVAMSCINADTYRHFGRLGGGAAMGVKNLKAIVVLGDAVFDLPPGRTYADLFSRVYGLVTATGMMTKYHNLGTAANLASLNKIRALPWRNLQATSDAAITGVSGERFAEEALLRNSACSGCPVGCIHVGFVREQFMAAHRYLLKQVAYDYEPIFSLGTMLGITSAFAVLDVLDQVERSGLDAMSAGVALAWATEATEKGVIGERETIVRLRFGDRDGYCRAVQALAGAENDFYRLLGRGTLHAAREYGGEEFACVLGQEMAGYATGEVFFVSQSQGFRHSHLDSGGYSYDQQHAERDVQAAVDFLVRDEAERCVLTSMVSCLFARSVYSRDLLGECLQSLGCPGLASGLEALGPRVQRMRWQLRIQTGFSPGSVAIPKRFYRLSNWKGAIDPAYLEELKGAYGRAIMALAGGGKSG